MKYAVAIALLMVGTALCQVTPKADDDLGASKVSLRNIAGPFARSLRKTGLKAGEAFVDLKNGDASELTKDVVDGVEAAVRGAAKSLDRVAPGVGTEPYLVFKPLAELFRMLVEIPASAIDPITKRIANTKPFVNY